MFLYDILERFSNSEFVNLNDLPSYSFCLTYLDARFNLWNYFLFFSIASLIFYFFKNGKRENVIQVLKRPLLLISSCWILPLSLFQTFANVQHHWYLAPILPFIAIVTYTLIEFLIERFYQFKYVFFVVLAFTIIRQFTFFNDAKSHPLFVQKIKDESHSCNEVFILGKQFKQAHLLYMSHTFPNRKMINSINEVEKLNPSTCLIFYRKNEWEEVFKNKKMELVFCEDREEVCFFRRK